jgi:hypothetical protein
MRVQAFFGALMLVMAAAQASGHAPATPAAGGAVPMTFLIGADGRILARDLRGEDLVKAVDGALK